MKVLVGAFNQKRLLIGAFSVITNLLLDLRFKLKGRRTGCEEILTQECGYRVCGLNCVDLMYRDTYVHTVRNEYLVRGRVAR